MPNAIERNRTVRVESNEKKKNLIRKTTAVSFQLNKLKVQHQKKNNVCKKKKM